MRSPSPVKSAVSDSPGEHQRGKRPSRGHVGGGGWRKGERDCETLSMWGVWREKILEGLWGGPQAEARDQEKESQGRWVWGLKDLTVLEAGG